MKKYFTTLSLALLLVVTPVVIHSLLDAKGIVDSQTKATFAGGCFWCMEGPFEAIYGVEDVVAGYTGGEIANPSYSEVSSGFHRSRGSHSNYFRSRAGRL